MSRILDNNRITQGYSNTHLAVDLGSKNYKDGDHVYAHTEGKVVSAVTGHKNNKGSVGTASYGNYIKIQHPNGYCTLYAHLASVSVKVGQTVKQRQKIGTMGNTGNSYGTHLHFEVRDEKNQKKNPTQYLDTDLPGMVLYFKRYVGTTVSIVTALSSLGYTSSYSYRSKIAKANGIKAYIGTAKQNGQLLSLLKAGTLIKP